MNTSDNLQRGNAIGNGEVDSSILSGSTIYPLQYKGFGDQPLHIPPLLNSERKSNFPQSVGENAGTMFPQCSQIIERDDGLFQIGIGDDAPGPFDSRAFAERVANGEKPANIRNDTGGKFRRFRIVREVRNAASA